MRRILGTVFAVTMLVAVSLPVLAQDASMAILKAPAMEKFGNLPDLPKCLTASVQRGDPGKEASVILLKFTAGCVVPWHWHTPNETVMMVSGQGKVEMKDAKPVIAGVGAYAYLPAKHAHQFTCLNGCMAFLTSDAGPFDTHYVDKDGKEISADQALARPKMMHKVMAKPVAK